MLFMCDTEKVHRACDLGQGVAQTQCPKVVETSVRQAIWRHWLLSTEMKTPRVFSAASVCRRRRG